MNVEAIDLLTKSAIYALASSLDTKYGPETYGTGLFTLLAM